MAYLVDTNVISELRKPRADPGVRAWFERSEDAELYLSVLVVGEIRRGVELVRRRDSSAARSLDRWLNGLQRRYAERILPVTLEICDVWGRLSVEQPLSPVDGLLAATALHHGMTLVTRNVADVLRSGVEVLNPFSD